MVIDAILKRRSVRDFSDEPVGEKDVEEMIKAAQFAPTAMNNRSVEFVVVRDRETKQRLFDSIAARQEFVKNAPVIVVPVTDPGKTPCPVQDLSIASENMMLQAASMGIGSVWKNLGDQDSYGVKKVLGIPEAMAVINMVCIGHPKAVPASHTDAGFSVGKMHKEKWM